jgi:hypothetical protein
MRALAVGAVIGIVWLVFGLPLPAVAALLPLLVQPVTIAFAAGLIARPYLDPSRRQT